MLLGKLRPLYFFSAFAIGLLFCYIITPPPEVVVKFPSPFNAGRVTYKDKARTCFQFDASKVSCPIDRSLIKPQPIMEDFRKNHSGGGGGSSGSSGGLTFPLR